MKRVMFYCQHVLGMGHFIRSMEIVRGLSDFHVRFLNGGEIVDGFGLPASVEVVQLPPLKSDAGFTAIQAVDDRQSMTDIKKARTQCILEEFERFQPDVVVIELFPFGRKKFAFELVPLLAHIRLRRGATKVVCSLRDILVRKRDQERHDMRACTLMNRYFDLLLIHADPNLQRFEETFAKVHELKTAIRYTGYVVQPPQQPVNTDAGDIPSSLGKTPLILVSIGGGRVGYELLDCAVEASARLEPVLSHRMLIYTGPYMPEEQFLHLQQRVVDRPHVLLQRYTTRFLAHMEQAALSISMAGYNTCMNILTTGVRAIVLPFTGGDNNEQTIRATKLEALGAVTVLRPQDLQPAILAEKILRGLETECTAPPIDIRGVENTARCLAEITQPPEAVHRSNSVSSGDREQRPEFRVLATELRPQLERLQHDGGEVTMFLRDDDIDEDDETLRHLLDITISRGVPVSLALIPGCLTDAGIALVKDYKGFDPDLFELHQHGWTHVNHEREGKKCEFGRSRSFDQQYEDIARGKALLEETLLERFYPAFTPPWNRCTEDTLKVLDQVGFRVVSRDHGAPPVTGYRFREISITLDLFRWKSGAMMKSPEAIVQHLIAQMQRRGTIGILLHHKVMEAHALAFLDSLLAELSRYPVVQFHTMQSLSQLPADAH